MSSLSKDDCFLSVKQSIDDNYKSQLLKAIKEFKNVFSQKMTNLLGENYLKYTENYLKINKTIKEKRKKFLSSQEYLIKKQELITKKNVLDGITDDALYEEYKKDFDKTLLELSTLNVKCNNTMKDDMLIESQALKDLRNLFDSKKEEVFKLKNQIEKDVLIKIKELLISYNTEIAKLKEVFGEVEMVNSPFDPSIINENAILNKFEIDYFTSDINDNDESVKVEIVNVDSYKSPNFDKKIN